jgi:hypothetical protein
MKDISGVHWDTKHKGEEGIEEMLWKEWEIMCSILKGAIMENRRK